MSFLPFLRRGLRLLPAALALFAIFQIIAMLLWLARQPAPVEINAGEHGTSVHIAVTNTVLDPADPCTQVEWNIEGIQGVFLNDNGEIGVYQKTLCDQDALTFRVIAQDKSRQTYTIPLLNPTKALVNALLWLAGAALVAIAMYFLPLTDAPRLHPVVVVLAVLLSAATLLRIFGTNVQIYYDAKEYVEFAYRLEQIGIVKYYLKIRPFGYPLFLLMNMQLAKLVPSIQPYFFIACVQFLFFHTTSALMAASIVTKLSPTRQIPHWLRYAVFFLVQFNPLLLGISFDLLPESSNIFLMTLLVFSLVARYRWRYLFISLAVCLLLVTKPFFATWFVILIAAWLIYQGITWLLFRRTRIDFGALRQRLVSGKTLFNVTQVLIPILLIMPFQILPTYNATGQFAVYATESNSLTALVLNLSTYVYKYETGISSAGIAYLDEQRHTSWSALLDTYPPPRSDAYTPAFKVYALADIPGAVHIALVRTIGLFQSFEWSTYRTETTTEANYVFLWGAGLSIAFVYINVYFVGQMLQRLRRRPAFTDVHETAWTLLFFVTTLLVLSYGLVTHGESRYILPIIPLLTVMGLYHLAVEKHPLRLLLIAVLTLAFYGYIFHILSVSQVLRYPIHLG